MVTRNVGHPNDFNLLPFIYSLNFAIVKRKPQTTNRSRFRSNFQRITYSYLRSNYWGVRHPCYRWRLILSLSSHTDCKLFFPCFFFSDISEIFRPRRRQVRQLRRPETVIDDDETPGTFLDSEYYIYNDLRDWCKQFSTLPSRFRISEIVIVNIIYH